MKVLSFQITIQSVFLDELQKKAVDENNQNNTLITTAQLPLELPSTFKLYIHTNNVNRAHENAFTIADTHGKVFYSDGDFTDNTEYSYDINMATQKQIIYPSLDPSIFEIRYPDSDIKGQVVID